MSGAAGRIKHLIDDYSLTFGELKDILRDFASGKLECYEKFDGVNVMFTWDEHRSQLRVARGSNDIKLGGLDAEALAVKFANRGNLTEAFVSSFGVLSKAISALDVGTRVHIFGLHGVRWHSLEIIYRSNPNVLHYDHDCLVFHENPIFEVDSKEGIKQAKRNGVKYILKNLSSMNEAVAGAGWKLLGPTPVDIPKFEDEFFVEETLTKIKRLQALFDVKDDETLEKYLTCYISADAFSKNIVSAIIPDVVARIIGSAGALTLVDIKKKVRPEAYQRIREYVKLDQQLVKKALAPLELAIHDFVAQVLRNVSSNLISNSAAERARVVEALKKSIVDIKASKDAPAHSAMWQYLPRLEPVDEVSCAIEGVVFERAGKIYKFTGSFAAINQILGALRYERGNRK